MKQIDEIKKLHQQGLLAEAHQGYLSILATHPEHVEALHLLAVLCMEEGNFQEALTWLQKAILLAPENVSLRLNLANIYKSQGMLAEAEAVLVDVLQLSPRFAAAHNNLGTLHYARGEWQQAIAAYQQAIDIQPDYLDAYYNLGLALQKDKRFVEALHVYEAALLLAPQHAGALYQQACLLMLLGKIKKAIESFVVLERMHPHHLETQTNLASCYLKSGLLAQAKMHYIKALEIAPADVQLLFNLGVINMQQGRIQEAIHYYLEALRHDPDNFEGHNNLGAAYLAIKDKHSALLHFREALRLHPQDEALRHTITILSGNEEAIPAPPEYIHTLFDSYAEHYDSHVVDVLQYQVPALIYEVLEAKGLATRSDLAILDLGCGTGLCGELFQRQAKTLVGVDLSPNMLALAAAKEVYTTLIQSDIATYLVSTGDQYDLVIAGDVMVYMADLTDIFQNVSRVLLPHGYFAFNIEAAEPHTDYAPISGRFMHGETYIARLAEKFHFKVLSAQAVTLRTQDKKPVRGFLFLLQNETIGVNSS